MGKAAVEAYMKALDEGECKIPYYSMLILGEQRVGKTSLYRQLVGKPFIENLDSTKGIDNKTVETVDARTITLGQEGQSSWKEVKLDPTNSFANAITEEAIRHMPEIQEKKEGSFVARGEKMLKDLINKLDKQLDPPPPRPKAVKSVTHQVNQQRIDLVPKFEFHDKLVAQPVKPPSSRGVREPSQPLPKVEKPKQSLEKSRENVAVKQKDVSPPASPVVDTFSAPLLNEFPVPPEPFPPSDTVKVEEEEEVQIEENGLMNRRQGISMAKKLKRRNKKIESKNPELTLNTLDFAGQVEYRPMHHCFISRRACYLVVFKIPELLECMGKEENVHFEEIRYWIHSINAHIYPPEKDKNDEDKTISRVILVGTHSESKSEEDLNNIDGLLDKLRWDSRCVNHLIKLKSPSSTCPYNNFIPVENSFDIKKKEDQYLKESCTAIVQESIKDLSKKLPFLKEDYPIKWLNFKERIEAMESSSPVITMEELIALAEKSLITNDQLKGQDVAIRFLHDSGKIRCLSKFA